MDEPKENQEESKDLPAKIAAASPSLQYFIGFLCLFGLASYLCTSISAPQFFEDLTIGNWIRGHGEVPRTFLWSVSGTGVDWHSTSWCFQLLLNFWEELLGYESFIILKLSLLVLGFFALMACYQRATKDFAIAGLLTTLVGCGIYTTNDFSAQLLAYPLFAILCERVLSIRERNFSIRPYEAFVCLLLLVLYANVHFSSIIFLVTAGVLLFERSEDDPDAGIRRPAIFFGVILFSQLLTPYFGAQLISAGEKMLQFLTLDLGLRLNPGTVFHYPIAFIVLLLLVFAAFWHSFPKGAARGIVILALASSIFAFASLEVAPYALFFLGLGIASIWGQAKRRGESLGNLGDAFTQFTRTLGAFPVLGSVFLLMCVLVVNVSNLWKQPFTDGLLPIAEADYLIEEDLKPPLLHNAFVGSYLVYRFANPDGTPKRQVLVSEQSEKLNPEFFESYHSFMALEKGWKSFYSSYAPNVVICRTNSLQRALLSQNPDWKLVLAYGQKFPSQAAESLLEKDTFGWLVFRRIG